MPFDEYEACAGGHVKYMEREWERDKKRCEKFVPGFFFCILFLI